MSRCSAGVVCRHIEQVLTLSPIIDRLHEATDRAPTSCQQEAALHSDSQRWMHTCTAEGSVHERRRRDVERPRQPDEPDIADVGGAALDLRHRDPADACCFAQIGLGPTTVSAGFGDALTEAGKIINTGRFDVRIEGDSRVMSPRAFRSPRLQRTAQD